MKEFILGILLMSLFSFLAILAFDNELGKLGLALSGPISWVVVLLLFCLSKVKDYLKFHNVRSLLICPDGEIRYINDRKADTMCNCIDKKYSFPDFYDHPEWDAKDWNNCFIFIKCGNVRYAPKKVWKQYEPINKQDYEYAKEHQNNEN